MNDVIGLSAAALKAKMMANEMQSPPEQVGQLLPSPASFIRILGSTSAKQSRFTFGKLTEGVY